MTQPAAAPVTVPAAAAAGRRYLTVARTWTPDTYLEQWRIQVRLSGGDLRAALRSARPTRAQLAQLQTDQSNATASVVAVTPISESGRSAKYRIVIAEQTVVAGVQQQEQTVNEVVVRRVDDRWAVTNATVVP